jgi:hypothetical protein
MELNNQLLIEAFVVGIVLVIFGKVVNNLKLNKSFHFELTLFLSGMLTHIGFELSGFNKWYCIHGNACK